MGIQNRRRRVGGRWRALRRSWGPFVRRNRRALGLGAAYLGGDLSGSALVLWLDEPSRAELLSIAEGFWAARLRQSCGQTAASSMLLGSLLLTVLLLAGCSTIAHWVAGPALFIRGLSFGVTACALFCATARPAAVLRLALPALLGFLLLAQAARQALERSLQLRAALQQPARAAPSGWRYPLSMAALYAGQLAVSVLEGLLFAGAGL